MCRRGVDLSKGSLTSHIGKRCPSGTSDKILERGGFSGRGQRSMDKTVTLRGKFKHSLSTGERIWSL